MMKSHTTKVSLVVLMTVCALLTVEAGVVKRGFVDLGCMGQYDKVGFAKLDSICEQCYELYRESGLHSMCRSYCFKNEYFNGCVKALLLDSQKPEFDVMVNKLFGGS